MVVVRSLITSTFTPAGISPSELRQGGVNAFNGLDDIRARLLEDNQECAGLARRRGAKQIVFGAVNRMADIGDPDRRPLLIREDDVAVIGRLHDLVVRGDREALQSAVYRALGCVGGDVAENRADVLQGEISRCQLFRIDLHTHRRLLLPADVNQSDAMNLRDLLRENILGVIVRFGKRRRVRGHRQDEDRRIRRVILAIVRRRGQICGEPPAGRRDRSLDVLRRGVDVPVQLELNVNLGIAKRIDRGELDDAGDLTELLLERVCDRGGHGLRARTGELSRHLNRWKIHLRQRSDRKIEKGRDPREGEGRHQKGRGYRPLDEGRRNIHVRPLASLAATGCASVLTGASG